MENILPESESLGRVITQGFGSLADFETSRFEI